MKGPFLGGRFCPGLQTSLDLILWIFAQGIAVCHFWVMDTSSCFTKQRLLNVCENVRACQCFVSAKGVVKESRSEGRIVMETGVVVRESGAQRTRNRGRVLFGMHDGDCHSSF